MITLLGITKDIGVFINTIPQAVKLMSLLLKGSTPDAQLVHYSGDHTLAGGNAGLRLLSTLTAHGELMEGYILPENTSGLLCLVVVIAG